MAKIDVEETTVERKFVLTMEMSEKEASDLYARMMYFTCPGRPTNIVQNLCDALNVLGLKYEFPAGVRSWKTEAVK